MTTKTDRDALELAMDAMDRYRDASARMDNALARGRLANAEFWRQMRESAVEEIWSALEHKS